MEPSSRAAPTGLVEPAMADLDTVRRPRRPREHPGLRYGHGVPGGEPGLALRPHLTRE